MKLQAEDARLALRNDPQRAAEMHMAFAGERVEEMRQVALAGEKVDSETRLRLEHHLANALHLAARIGDDGQMVGLLQRMQERYQTYEQELSELHAEAQQAAGPELAQAQRRLREAAQVAGNGVEAPAQYRWRHAHNRSEEAPPYPEDPGKADPSPLGNQYGRPEDAGGEGQDHQNQNQHGPPEGAPGPHGAPNQHDEIQKQHQYGPLEGAPNQGDENQNQYQYGAPDDASGPAGTANQGDETQNQNQYGSPEDAPSSAGTPNQGEGTPNQQQSGQPEDAPGPSHTPGQGGENQQHNGSGEEPPSGEKAGNDSGQAGGSEGSGDAGNGSGGQRGGG